MQKLFKIALILILSLQVGSFSLGNGGNETDDTDPVQEQCKNTLTKHAGIIIFPATKMSTANSQVCGIRVDKAVAIHLMFRRKQKTLGGINIHALNVAIYDQKPGQGRLPLDEWRSHEGGAMKVVHRNEIWLVIIYSENNEIRSKHDFDWVLAYTAEIGGVIPSCDISRLNLPANGIIVSDKNCTFGSVVNLQCLEGYVRESGQEYAVCTVVGDTLSWVVSGSICRSICHHPPAVKHAKAYIETNRLKDCKNSDGDNNSTADCLPYRTNINRTDTKVSYVCHEPFVTNGLTSLECGYDIMGVPRWLLSPPSCIIPDCSTTIVLRKSSGSLVNPDYPGLHLSGGSLTCLWEISCPDDSYIHLTVTYLDLPDLPGVEVVVFDNESTRPRQLLRLINKSHSVRSDSRSSKVTVTFHGPPSEVRGHRGFYIRYVTKLRGSRHRRNSGNDQKLHTSSPLVADPATPSTASFALAADPVTPSTASLPLVADPATTSTASFALAADPVTPSTTSFALAAAPVTPSTASLPLVADSTTPSTAPETSSEGSSTSTPSDGASSTPTSATVSTESSQQSIGELTPKKNHVDPNIDATTKWSSVELHQSTRYSTQSSTEQLAAISSSQTIFVSTEPSTDQPTSLSSETSTEPASHQSTEHTAETSTEQSTETSTGQSTEHYLEQTTATSTQESSVTSTEQSTIASTQLFTGNSTEQSTIASTQLFTGNSTEQSTIASTQLFTGNSTEQSTIASTQLFTGNSSEQSTITSTQLFTGNSTEQSTIASTQLFTGNSSEQSTITSTQLFTGNSTEQPMIASTELFTGHSPEQPTQFTYQSINLSTEQHPDTTPGQPTANSFETTPVASNLPRNETGPAASEESDDDWKIAVGVVIPIIFLLLVLVGVYICYRKKYPVRMIIGREFAKFSNPNYNHRAHAPTLVREDADFYFANGSTLNMPSEEFNPVNNKIMYDNMGFIRDDGPDEDEKERKFLQNKSWLFKKTQSEPQTTVEVVTETTAESSFITMSLFTAGNSPHEEKRDKMAYTDADISEILSDESPKPKPKPRLKKKARSASTDSSDTYQPNGQIRTPDISDSNGELGSSLPRDKGPHSVNQRNVNEPANKDDINSYLKNPISLFNQPSFDEVWAEVKARSKSLSTESTPDSRSRSLSFDPSKSARKMSLHDDLQAMSHLRSLAEQRLPSPPAVGNNGITAFIVEVDVRNRDNSITSSILLGEDSEEEAISKKKKEECDSISSLNSDSYIVTDFEEIKSHSTEGYKNVNQANGDDHLINNAPSLEDNTSKEREMITKKGAQLQTVDKHSPANGDDRQRSLQTNLVQSNSSHLDDTDFSTTKDNVDKNNSFVILPETTANRAASNDLDRDTVKVSQFANNNRQSELDGDDVPGNNDPLGEAPPGDGRRQLAPRSSAGSSSSSAELFNGSLESFGELSIDDENEGSQFSDNLKDKKAGQERRDEQRVPIFPTSQLAASPPLHLQVGVREGSPMFPGLENPDYINLNISKLQFSDSSSDSSDISPRKDIILLSKYLPSSTHHGRGDKNSTSLNVDDVHDDVSDNSSNDEHTNVDDEVAKTMFLSDSDAATYRLDDGGIVDNDIDV